MLLIKNGRVVDPVTGVDEVMDVLIEGAHIEEVGHNLSAAGAEVIDAAGLVVAPGLGGYPCSFQGSGTDLQGGYSDWGSSSGEGRFYNGCVHGQYKADGR